MRMAFDYEEKEVKPYKPHELKALFQAADDEAKLWMSHFLNTGCREREVLPIEFSSPAWCRTRISRASYYASAYAKNRFANFTCREQ